MNNIYGGVCEMTLLVTKLLNYRSCDECSGQLISADGYLVCNGCGLVHENILVHVNHKTSIEYRKRVFSCTNDSTFNAYYSAKFNKLSKWNNLPTTYDPFLERKELLERICAFLNITHTARLRALLLFKNYCENRKNVNTHFEQSSNFLAVSIIQAVKENKIPITLDQLFGTFTKFNLRVNRRAVIKHRIQNNHKARMTVKDYVFTYEEKLLKAKPELERETEKVQELIQTYRSFQGFKPTLFSVAVLYVVYKPQKVSIHFLHELFDVSCFGISANSKKIKKKFQEIKELQKEIKTLKKARDIRIRRI